MISKINLSNSNHYKTQPIRRFVKSLYYANRPLEIGFEKPKKLPFGVRIGKFFKSLYYANHKI